jgi:tripeptidyl-peptidase-1
VIKRTVQTTRGSPHASKAPAYLKASTEAHVLSEAEAALPPALQNCSTNITPDCIRALYGIPKSPKAIPGNSLGLYQQGSYFAKSDVNAYFKTYAPYIPQDTFPIAATIDGASYSVDAASVSNSGEANIDIEMG